MDVHICRSSFKKEEIGSLQWDVVVEFADFALLSGGRRHALTRKVSDILPHSPVQARTRGAEAGPELCGEESQPILVANVGQRGGQEEECCRLSLQFVDALHVVAFPEACSPSPP